MGRQLSFYARARGRGEVAQERAPRKTSFVGTGTAAVAPLPPFDRRRAVVDALLRFGAMSSAGPPLTIGPDAESDQLVRNDGFAFLVAVLFDQGIAYERAWRAPLELKRRLGTLAPTFIVANPAAVQKAVASPPELHRFVKNVSRWLIDAARRVIEDYSGDAERIWSGRPPAEVLRNRLESFLGVGQKKAAMAVEILERQRGAKITHLEGSDIAFDVHVRRVFLRSGLAERDDRAHLVQAARLLHPKRPGALDYPAWWVGHEWCRPTEPRCDSCPIRQVCPQHKGRALNVN